jgi:hypothetical protein
MNMFQKLLVTNILLSIALFSLIFYYFLGVSGGDMAILAFTIFANILLILVNIIFVKKIQIQLKLYLILVVFLFLIIEIFFFLKFGYYINTMLR